MRFTDKDRLRIIAEWAEASPGEARAAIAKKYGIKMPTVSRWKRMFSKRWRLGKVRQ
jgi:transposase-like protein